jgi:hypothetical protein
MKIPDQVAETDIQILGAILDFGFRISDLLYRFALSFLLPEYFKQVCFGKGKD